jgi:hypothetical protein
MFALPLIQSSVHLRTGVAQWLAEFVATFGLLLAVLGHRRKQDGPWMIAAWIGAAYWFTSSTSFANPANHRALPIEHFRGDHAFACDGVHPRSDPRRGGGRPRRSNIVRATQRWGCRRVTAVTRRIR